MEVTHGENQSVTLNPMDAALSAMDNAMKPPEPPKEEVKQEAQVPETKEEIKQEPPKEEKKEEEKISAQKFAALARKTKEQFQKDQELKARERDLTERLEKLERMQKDFEDLKSDPDRLLASAGYDYEKLTKMKLNDGRTTPEIIAEQALLETKKLREDQKRRDEQYKQEQIKAQQAQVEAQTQQFKNNIYATISKDMDKYELINLTGSHNLIYDGIVAKYNETGEVSSIEDAADAVEKYLEEQLEAIETKSKKWQARKKPKEEVKAPAKPNQTLNNNMQSSVATTLPALTEEERIKRALAALDV